MNMWAVLMIVLLVLSFAGILYLSSRIGRFAIIKKIVKGKKGWHMLAGLVIMLAVSAILWLAWGAMNVIICVLHLLVFWVISEAVFALITKVARRKFTRYYAGVIAVVFTVCYLGVGWYCAHHVWEAPYEIQTDKEVGTLKAAVFADSHVGATFDGEGFAEHMKTIEAQKPDIIVIAGDFVDDDTSKEDMIRSCRALGSIQCTYGVYYVFGNHDKGYYPPEYRGYSGDDLIKELKKNHVHVMEDDVELIDDRFYIIGRADKSEEYSSGRKSMEELTEDIDPDKFSIVIDHQPDDYAAQAESGVDLVLSGHTHGGQLFPLMNIENLIDITPEDRVYGREKRGNTNFIVTSGIADWAIKFKTGCISEYLMIDIHGKK